MQDLVYINQLLLQEINQLRSVIDCLPGAIYWKNLSGKYMGRNTAAKQSMLDKGFGECEVIGLTDFEIFPGQTAKEFTTHDNEVIKNDKEQTHEETELLPDGGININYSIKRPLKLQGETIGVIGNSINITHLKHVENELKNLKKQLQHAELSKKSFLKNIEHDLKTPSSIISLSTSHLRKTDDHDKKNELLDNIDFSTRQIIDHFSQLIEFTRLNSQQIPSTNELLNIRHLVKRITHGFKVKQTDDLVDIKFHVTQQTPDMIYSSPYAISRALTNLLENALMFTQEGEISINVDFDETGQDSENKLIVTVQDTGTGIDPDHLPNIFEPFYKYHNSLNSINTGSGLGLSIVKELLQQLKGSISVSSQLGIGSKFCFDIPISQFESSNEINTLHTRHRINTNLHILLIEDNELCSKLTSHLLQEHGYDVKVASEKSDALDLASQHVFDLILTDIDLPDINGIELSSLLKSRYLHLSDTKVFTLSAFSAESYSDEIARHSITACLNKPFEFDAFQEQIKRSFVKTDDSDNI